MPTPEIVLKRIAIRVAALLPDDSVDAATVLRHAAGLVEGFLADRHFGLGTEAPTRSERTPCAIPDISPVNM